MKKKKKTRFTSSLSLVPGRCHTCSKLCSLTPLSPASTEAIFLAASTFPSARRSALTVSLWHVLQQESSRTTEDGSSWSLATPWKVLLWWDSCHTHTHTHTHTCVQHTMEMSYTCTLLYSQGQGYVSEMLCVTSYSDIGWYHYCSKVHYKYWENSS